MARVFAFLITGNREVTDTNIFNDVSEVIGDALKAVYQKNNSGKRIAETSFSIALKKLNR